MFFCSHNVLAEKNITIIINNNTVEFPDQKPVIINDKTFMPVRIIAESLEAEVEWAQETKTAIITKNSIKIKASIDNSTLILINNGIETEIFMDVFPVLLNGRTMLPIRYIAENLGYKVDFYEEESDIIISDFENKKIIVGTNAEFPPFEYLDGEGEPTGFDIELIKACADVAGFEVEFVNMEFGALIAALNSGKIDIIASAESAELAYQLNQCGFSGICNNLYK